MKIIVVPCFNEGDTLDSNKFASFLGQNPDVSIVFSNDGSTDNTFEVLEAIKSQFSERVYITQFETNQGKAAERYNPHCIHSCQNLTVHAFP